MRILMVNHTPWSRNLGAPRVQLEIAEEWRQMGHEVEKFSYEDAFPHQQSRWEQMTCNFSQQARRYVKENAHRFDIIEANQTDLPFNKKELGIRGLLVARSVGLIPMYAEFYEWERKKWPEKTTVKSLIRKVIGYPAARRRNHDVLPSLKASDLINVPNKDEFIYIRDQMGLGDKCVSFPFGLSQERQIALAQAVQPPATRLANPKVAFIGVWCTRKGSKDWAEIIQRTRATVPNTEFLFLGTAFDKAFILKDLGLPNCDWIQVVPSFESEELPQYLSSATVGAFPSYVEGFGFAVLEKLACGLPTVVYDVPGPREMLRYLDSDWMVTPGNVEQFSVQLINLLQLNAVTYNQLSQSCVEVAKKFDWREIATQTLETYQNCLAQIKANG